MWDIYDEVDRLHVFFSEDDRLHVNTNKIVGINFLGI